MSKILLDYVFPISVIPSVPAASTAFLKQACLVVKPKAGQEGSVGQVFMCTSMGQVADLTDNENAEQLFAAGMSRVYVLLADHLDIAAPLSENHGDFWTVLISDDFDDEDIDTEKATLTKGDLTFTAKSAGGSGNEISIELLGTVSAGDEAVTVTGKKISVAIEDGVSTATQIKTAIDNSAAAMALIEEVVIADGKSSTAQAAFAEDNLEGGSGQSYGTFDGVVAYSTTDAEVAADFSSQENRCAFFTKADNGATNMCYAFGKLLSNLTNWVNQQYISMPADDGVDKLGDANALFDDRVSFVIHDDELGDRLALFAVGGKAIAAPYIEKNLRIDMQSRAVQWIAANQPAYTLTNAALLEQRLQEDVINQRYVETGLIEAGEVEVRLLQGNFVASGFINVAEPKALWRIFGEMRSTL